MASEPQTRIAAEDYLDALAVHDIDHLFCNPGTDFAPIVEAFARAARTNRKVPRPMVVPHENCALAMAHGYAMITRKPQAVMLHTDVGTANAINALIDASRDRVPVLLTSGRTPFTERGASGARNVYIHWAQEMYDQAGMLREMVKKLEAETGHIEMTFPYFVSKKAPVSGVESLMDYKASLIGELRDGKPELWLKVVVAATSLCPCSKRISDYGAHNQRSHITIKARVDGHMWLEELIDIAEEEASCEVFGILKRPDEKYVTERAYDNPKFVEDLVRDVALRLNADARVGRYCVDVENFESIHNHSACARIERA